MCAISKVVFITLYCTSISIKPFIIYLFILFWPASDLAQRNAFSSADSQCTQSILLLVIMPIALAPNQAVFNTVSSVITGLDL